MQSLIQRQLLIRYRHKHATYWVDVIIPQMDYNPLATSVQRNKSKLVADRQASSTTNQRCQARAHYYNKRNVARVFGYWVRWQASLEAKWPKDEEEICRSAPRNGMRQIRSQKGVEKSVMY